MAVKEHIGRVEKMPALGTATDSLNPGFISTICPCVRHLFSIASVDSAVEYVLD